MKNDFKVLLKEVFINLLISIGIFAAVLIFLYFCGLIVKDGQLINPYLPLELVAGIIGTAYILIVKNPNNYLGFAIGIIMSVLLGVQFYLEGFKDLTILYYCVFIPCQIYTLIKWKRGNNQDMDSEYAIPSFMDVKRFFVVLCILAILMIADLFLLQDEFTTAAVISSAIVGSSTLANFLMIRKRTDAWFYWVIFSICGVILMILSHNYVTLTLYTIYLFINGNVCIAWCKQTPKDRYGWLKLFTKKS